MLLGLKRGLNLVALPILPAATPDSLALAASFGPNLLNLSRIDPAGLQLQTVAAIAGALQGDSFPVVAKEGYLVQMSADTRITLIGANASDAIDLVVGLNLAGFRQVPDSMTAHQLLLLIGDPSTITSISRYQREHGRFTTVAYRDGTITGPDFPIRRGESYLFSMQQAVTGLVLP